MKSSAELAIITAFAAVAALGHWFVDGRPSGMPEDDFMAAAEQGDLPPLKQGEVRLADVADIEGVLWVDARRRDRWERDGLPGSINLTNLSDEDLVTQLARYENELFGASMMVIYCDDLNCSLSHDLAKQLKTGFSGLVPDDIRVLQGGHVALRAAGRITNSSPEP
jgi:hypothetical protein